MIKINLNCYSQLKNIYFRVPYKHLLTTNAMYNTTINQIETEIQRIVQMCTYIFYYNNGFSMQYFIAHILHNINLANWNAINRGFFFVLSLCMETDMMSNTMIAQVNIIIITYDRLISFKYIAQEAFTAKSIHHKNKISNLHVNNLNSKLFSENYYTKYTYKYDD